MARTAKRYKKNTEKKIPGIPVCMAAIYFSGQSRGGRDPLIAETWKQRFILILERLLKDEYRTQLRTQAHNAGITVNDYYKYMSNMYNS